MSNFTSGPIRQDRGFFSRAISLGGCLGSCGAIAGIGGAAIGIIVAILAVFSPNLLSGAMAKLTGVPLPETRAITGTANAWDPIANYISVATFAAPSAQLISFTATSVRPDGTLDLTATYSPAPRADFKFVHEVDRPANAPPVGAGSTGRGPWYEPVSIGVYQPGQRRHFYYSGGGVSADMDYVNEGMERQLDDPTTTLPGTIAAPPKCALADLWKTAQSKSDAPSDAVATISYDADGYSFSISALSIYLSFDTECRITD
jgi:hypothetical protein